jgi:hypothetical protein
MGYSKTVTEKTLAANRLNAKRSTGPRTERGKNTSKFNAVRTGLFAKHLVIPVCDGERSGQQFTELLVDVRQEFQPEGPFEEFCLVQMAECMWRLRRASRAVRGSVRNFLVWESEPPSTYREVQYYIKAVSTLERAKKEIMTTGTLSPASYAAVLSPLGIINSSTEPKIDDQFLPFLEWMTAKAHSSAEGWSSCAEQLEEDYYAMHAIPSELAMNKILQYERAAQKKFDWALQKLLESQKRRQKDGSPARHLGSSEQ